MQGRDIPKITVICSNVGTRINNADNASIGCANVVCTHHSKLAEVKTLKQVNNSVELDDLQTIYNWSNMFIDSIYCIQSYLALYKIRFVS